MARLVKNDLFPNLAGLVQPAKHAKSIVETERRKLQPGVNLDKSVVALLNDAAAVDAALYFASREMAGVGDLSRSDFEMLTHPEMTGGGIQSYGRIGG